MLSINYPDINEALKPKEWYKVPKVKFYGSYARKAGMYDGIYDVIVDSNFEIPKMDINIAGNEKKTRNEKDQYLIGKFSKLKFHNHYSSYFGGDQGLIEYTFDNSSTGNLLVISDSYDNCIEPFLACHFSHSYFVDLRLYYHDVGKDFNIDDFIKEHFITDVLFLGNQNWVLGISILEPYKFD